MLILVVLWTTWLFSALLAYWGPRKTASVILSVFGSFWAVFVLASIIGTESQDVTVVNMLLASLMGSIVVVPFFVLARKAGRWPRGTGVALFTVAALFLVMFVPVWVERSMKLPDLLLTATLLIVPLVATGIALLREGPQSEESDAPTDVAG
jgi:peptidoglycan/LPS O-acetylase OafA/YrhL